MRLLLRWLINAVALLVAAWLVPGIHFGPAGQTLSGMDWGAVLIVALIFGIVNAVIRPIVAFLSFPLTIITLGLFTFVINALMLLLTSGIAQRLGFSFLVDSFWPALLGALVISIVSFLLTRIAERE